MAQTINHSKLLEIQKTIREVPKVKVYNTQEALSALKGDVYALRKKGYDSKEIVKILKDAGLKVSVAKIKQITDFNPENSSPQMEQPQELSKGDPNENDT